MKKQLLEVGDGGIGGHEGGLSQGGSAQGGLDLWTHQTTRDHTYERFVVYQIELHRLLNMLLSARNPSKSKSPYTVLESQTTQNRGILI